MFGKLGYREHEGYNLIPKNLKLATEIGGFIDKKYGQIEIKLH